MGIASKPEPRGIFPVYDDASAADNPSLLASDLGADEYRSPEDETHQAEEELKEMVDRKWIFRFRCKHMAKRYVRGRIVLSKIVVINKT